MCNFQNQHNISHHNPIGLVITIYLHCGAPNRYFCWFISPVNIIVIGIIDDSYLRYVHQLSDFIYAGPTLYISPSHMNYQYPTWFLEMFATPMSVGPPLCDPPVEQRSTREGEGGGFWWGSRGRSAQWIGWGKSSPETCWVLPFYYRISWAKGLRKLYYMITD